MPSFLAPMWNRIFGRHPPNRRSGKRHRRNSAKWRTPLSMDCLEARTLLSRFAVLDFDGEALVTAAEMSQGGWSTGDVSFASFLTGTNAAVRDQIVQMVKTHFAPYDLMIFAGDRAAFQGPGTLDILNDAVKGDVLVLITGDNGLGGPSLAPWSDLGNEHDEIVVVGGSNFAGTDVNGIAKAISSAMGHAFGLGSPNVASENPAAITHDIMSSAQYVSPDSSHYFNFQDLLYTTDVFNFAFQPSNAHPEFNATNLQNQHTYLSHPDVLGPSPFAWQAVLRPGELTVLGNGQNEVIAVRKFGASAGVTTSSLGSLQVTDKVGVTSNFGVTYRPDKVALSNPGLLSLNPYATPLGTILIYGQDGNDKITIPASVGVSAVSPPLGKPILSARIFGGVGNDTITGSSGDDYIDGGNGADLLSGMKGNDVIFGGVFDIGNDTLKGGVGSDFLVGDEGNDNLDGGAGDDFLDGGDGDDLVSGAAGNDSLKGGIGIDTLVGGAGNDTLDGTGDGLIDQLRGNGGSDTFVQHILCPTFFTCGDEDLVLDKTALDTIVYA